MKALDWLWPGLGIKRWLLLFAAGLLLTACGLAIILDRATLLRLDWLVRLYLFEATGRFVPARVSGLLLGGAGVLALAASVRGVQRTLAALLLPELEGGVAERIASLRRAGRGPRVVAIGGGTGLSTLLRGLKAYTSNLTAIVTVSDDGGSSGRLRREMGIPPPGDVRNVLVALADTEPLLEQLFQHRFRRGSLAGHSFGNLFIVALTEVLGDFEAAVRESSKVLAVQGQVLPSTDRPVTLVAELEGGDRVQGETAIVARRGRIRRLELDPPDVAPLPAAVRAIEEADLIVLGPGSLYTSVLPNLLIPGLAEALRRARAPRVLVTNAMTQPGETDGYSASDHVRAVLDHVGRGVVDVAVVNTGLPDEERLRPYREQGAEPVRPDVGRVSALGVQVVAADLLGGDRLVRHDPDRLARVLLRLYLHGGRRGPRRWLDDLLLAERLRRQARVEAGAR